ncbi:acyl-CoA thioesterase [Alicyclobacillus cycloheptanicus]|uniref:Acyl-CoA thioester hydrolase n=1 Tax=Alicyclobacillus cycloheptanicus TaxID=1457 RepID=A0ABT9XEU4_9BACL|nr:acyl-CoA thioesterase [Alicyclobacillus cycloheptanicus]MDQ0188816.1 acyl-CoA thioester hydrolase [Alicyclobacillus cycloheptanicus]WDM00535.1 acyl-CoA thioesterase [Alicyclobacillus cycloheptanicus]
MPEMSVTELEVRWGECDPAGIVYHPAYLDWFSVARMHYLRENGISYMETFHDNGIVLVVLEARCRYRKTVRAEDVIRVEARMAERTRTRIKMVYRVYDQDGNLCGEGETHHAYVDEQNRAVNVAKRAPELWALLQQLPVEKDTSSD